MTGLLIFIGLILVILNVLAIKKQNKSFNGVLGNAIGNVNDFDIEVAQLRREFSESILELQSEVMGLKEIIDKNNKVKHYDEPVQEANKIEQTYDDGINEILDNSQTAFQQPLRSNSVKVDEIKRLFSAGRTENEIAEILHLGKGEVLLIKDLYIR